MTKVDGTLIEAWAGQKSFPSKNKEGEKQDPPPPNAGRNPTVNFRKEQRRNDTHQSFTDPEALLYGKSNGTEAKLALRGIC